MPQKKEVVIRTDGLFGMLGPVIKRAIEEESGRLLAELEGMIAARARDQLLVALQDRLAEKAPNPVNQVVAPPAKRKAMTRGRKRATAPAGAVGKICNVRGCLRPQRSVGYCSSHYQSSRKYNWPSPCPPGFSPPVRPRGRPPKAKAGGLPMPATVVGESR